MDNKITNVLKYKYLIELLIKQINYLIEYEIRNNIICDRSNNSIGLLFAASTGLFCVPIIAFIFAASSNGLFIGVLKQMLQQVMGYYQIHSWLSIVSCSSMRNIKNITSQNELYIVVHPRNEHNKIKLIYMLGWITIYVANILLYILTKEHNKIQSLYQNSIWYDALTSGTSSCDKLLSRFYIASSGTFHLFICFLH